VSAQEYGYLSFSTKNGLAGDNIYGITQDNDGFIWIGTETGLSRFDGTSFKNYTAEDGLPSNEIIGLLSDRYGRLWISPFKKEIAVLYKGKIYNRRNAPWVAAIPVPSEVKAIVEDVSGNILVQSDSFSCMVYPDFSLRCFKNPYHSRGFFRPLKGFHHIRNEIMDPELLKSCPARNNQTRYSLCGYEVNARQPYYQYMREGEEVLVYDHGKLLSVIPIPASLNASGASFWDTTFIVNNSNGTLVYDVRTGMATHHLLEGYKINQTYADAEGGYWVGSQGYGLFYIPSTRVVSIKNPGKKGPLQVNCFYTMNGRLLANINNTAIREINRNNHTLGKSLTDKAVDLGFFIPPLGNIIKFPGDALRSKFIKTDFKTVRTSIKSLSYDQNRFLVATPIGVGEVSHSSDTAPHKIWGGRATCAWSLNSVCYVGTLNGLYRFHNDGTAHTEANSQLLVKGIINATAYSYRNNLLWVTTNDNGVFCLKNDSVIKVINENSGLVSNSCRCIYTDGSNVYIGTARGLNIIHPEQDFLIENYCTLDGLISDNINCVYAESNQMWVGTPEGISCIDLSIPPKKRVPKLNITDLVVSGKNIPYRDKITLEPQHNNIGLRYSGIAYYSIGKIMYHYRMAGLKDEWQITDQPYLEYPSLPPGSYTFEIYATDRYNNKTGTTRIEIVVRQYWWQYRWLQFLSMVLLLLVVFLLLRLRQKRAQWREHEKMALKEKILDLEQLALRAQLNPHFIFNSLNSFYQYVIHRDLAGASKFINDFSRLIRLLFETAALTEISLDKEISFLSIYMELEKTKLNNIFSYHIVVDEHIHPEEVIIPSFVLQPFVENSIRHGLQNRGDDKGELSVSFAMEQENMLTVVIDDNGVGRSYTSALREKSITVQQSKGILLTEQRIQLYNKTHHTDVRFTIVDKYDDGKATGTTIRFWFPLTNHSL
jgi:two-component sensor histidine kinase